MKKLVNYQAKALELRQKGLTYSEILREVPVSQSSISLWCRGINLTKNQMERIQKKRNAAVQMGAISRHRNAVTLKQNILTKSKREIKHISTRELWLIGVALYWAEGSKQNPKNTSQGVKFTNSDSDMIKLFNLWLTKVAKVESDSIIYEIYIHESMSRKIDKIVTYWSKILEQPRNKFDRIYLKKNIITKSYPKSDYKGVVRIVVKRSTNLNRRIAGWQQGIVHHCRVV